MAFSHPKRLVCQRFSQTETGIADGIYGKRKKIRFVIEKYKKISFTGSVIMTSSMSSSSVTVPFVVATAAMADAVVANVANVDDGAVVTAAAGGVGASSSKSI